MQGYPRLHLHPHLLQVGAHSRPQGNSHLYFHAGTWQVRPGAEQMWDALRDLLTNNLKQFRN